MEHFPLPKNPAIGTLRIPFLCTEKYDGGDFLSYPERHSWTLQGSPNTTSLLRDGVKASMQEIGAFLQTWLIFGLIHEVTGKEPDIDAFQRHEAGSNFFCTTPLPDLLTTWQIETLRQEWSKDAVKLKEWAGPIATCLNRSDDTLFRLRSSPGYTELDSVLLGLAAIEECIRNACVLDILGYRGVEVLFKIPHSRCKLERKDPCDILLRSMRENGWCPNKIKRLDAFSRMSIGVCWFMANVIPSGATRDHSICSDESCAYLHTPEAAYQIEHCSLCPGCVQLGPNLDQMRTTIDDGSLPVITFVDRSVGELSVKVERMDKSSFVAISHVWADGHGNPYENTLPACFLRQLQTMVNDLPMEKPQSNTPFWIDTLCVPRRPFALRRQALTRLQEPYVNANHVLVLDSYLQSLSSEDMHPIDLVARIRAGVWVERLWTFQEGRLGKQIWFRFKDKALQLSQVVDSWEKSLRGRPRAPKTKVRLDILFGYNATIVLSHLEVPFFFHSTAALRGALSTRSTSEATDEALCLASLLRMDLTRLLDTSPEKRMETFWTLVEDIPWTLFSSKATRKLEVPGLRWAPATFMGDYDNLNWTGSVPCYPWDEKKCKITDGGIAIDIEALVLGTLSEAHSSVKTSPPGLRSSLRAIPGMKHRGLIFVDAADRWYQCYPEENWHQTPMSHVNTEEEGFAVILPSPWEPDVLYFADDFRSAIMDSGMFVTYNITAAATKSTPIYARAHRHVTIKPMAPKMVQLWKMFRRCAALVLRSDETSALDSETLLSDAQCLRPQVEKFVMEEPGLLELDREINHYHGNPSSDESTIMTALESVRNLSSGLDVFSIELMSETTWCFD